MNTIQHERKGLGTWIEISRSALAHNYQELRKIITPQTKLCAVLKSNAYGTDFMAMGKEVQALGIDWIAVGNVTEAIRLREQGITLPILILYYTPSESIADAVHADVSVTISQFENLEYIGTQKFAQPVKMHIKVDTGMHRQGFEQDQAEKLFATLKKYPNIVVEGVYSHFASAGTPEHQEKTQQQIEIFNWWKEQFVEHGFAPLFHLAATGGVIAHPETAYDMVRIGMGLYGVWPSVEVKAIGENKIDLHPVLSWKGIISEIKHVKKGESVGYDFTHTFDQDSTIAIVPVGYWHGYPRALSNIGEILVNGKRAKVIGRVSMSMIIVDITNAGEAHVQDEIVLIGTQKTETITAIEIAQSIQSSWYELLTRLNPLMKRIYF